MGLLTEVQDFRDIHGNLTCELQRRVQNDCHRPVIDFSMHAHHPPIAKMLRHCLHRHKRRNILHEFSHYTEILEKNQIEIEWVLCLHLPVLCLRHLSHSNTLHHLFRPQQNHLNFFFNNVDHSQTLAFTRTLLQSPGTIFFSGVGKSGFVAHKISQTLVSLGIRSAFLSPVDALHGDIGILTDQDVLVFSKSSTTEELIRLVPSARDKGAHLIPVTSVEGNPLAGMCDMNVHLPLERELRPFDLAPVTSAAIQMVFGDTVAIALVSARNLSKEQYASNHPAGRIGKSLIFKVKDVMKKQDELPICREGDLIMDQLVELTSKGCGCLLVIDEHHHLIGTLTDGDLRRILEARGEGIFKLTVGQMCNRNPRLISPDAMAVEAMKKMKAPPSPLQFLPVINDENILIGLVTLHGLVSAGL